MLSAAECRVLVTHCSSHLVAKCEQCQKHDTFAELGSDVLGRRYFFCPPCRLDLVDQLREHILTCPAILAELGKRIEGSARLMKTSDELRAASEILAAESQARSQRIRETKLEWSDVTPEKTIVRHIAAVLGHGGKICVRCVASDAGVTISELMQHVQIVASSILITMDRGRCRECGREDTRLSFGETSR